MNTLHLTVMIFGQLLLVAFLLYSSLVSASPVNPPNQQQQPSVQYEQQQPGKLVAALEHAVPAPRAASEPEPQQQPSRATPELTASASRTSPSDPQESPVVVVSPERSTNGVSSVKTLASRFKLEAEAAAKAVPQAVVPPTEVRQQASEVASAVALQSAEPLGSVERVPLRPAPAEPVSASVVLVVQSPEPKLVLVSQQVDPVHEAATPVVKSPVKQQELEAKSEPQMASVVSVSQMVAPMVSRPQSSPVVNGGLGPLHLLAGTLCSHQPEKPVTDDTQSALYQRRASVRKSLFDFMSLKFTSLEKLSSKLNPGLEVVPPRTADPVGAGGLAPSHGWPVVGKCTAHDLKLMAEAAWCESPASSEPVAPLANPGPGKEPAGEPKLPGRAQSGRSMLSETLVASSAPLDAPQASGGVVVADQSAVISKILHVGDIKDAPIVEGSISQLNLTQQQLADIHQEALSTRTCRRNALKLTKALLSHLAEDQRAPSDSWPQLYTQIASDDCARRRMIDILNALSSYRSDSTTIRRDNLEYAFAMDDLRSKVLDSEINVPLTFDKQFIEVEQFLQQSVKLMLANIDPERAKLTQMRYRSLMPGALFADDNCLELHQRLLAKNHPTDCNPMQFGQLADVLRMAAGSLELWSIDYELNKRANSHRLVLHPNQQQQQDLTSSLSMAFPHQTQRQEVNECIANLVSS